MIRQKIKSKSSLIYLFVRYLIIYRWQSCRVSGLSLVMNCWWAWQWTPELYTLKTCLQPVNLHTLCFLYNFIFLAIIYNTTPSPGLSIFIYKNKYSGKVFAYIGVTR